MQDNRGRARNEYYRSDEFKKKFLDIFRISKSLEDAIFKADVGRNSIFNIRKEDPEFDAEIKKIKETRGSKKIKTAKQKQMFLEKYKKLRNAERALRALDFGNHWVSRWARDDEEFKKEYYALKEDKHSHLKRLKAEKRAQKLSDEEEEKRKELFLESYPQCKSRRTAFNASGVWRALFNEWLETDYVFRNKYLKLRNHGQRRGKYHYVEKEEGVINLNVRYHDRHPRKNLYSYWSHARSVFKKHYKKDDIFLSGLEAIRAAMKLCEHKDLMPVERTEYYWCKHCGALLLEEPAHLGYNLSKDSTLEVSSKIILDSKQGR